tara:strand:- start:292 stop:474 length:183 start_codon:yes stop_codon:yes gene_type:complete
MTEDDIITAVDKILEDLELRKKIGITKHDRRNIINRRSIPKMLELLYKAGRLKIKDGPSK